jgi:polysaccharide pyruvyl transferase WcaK-like protein
MKVYAPFGFYGAGNIGDEATLQGFARLVELAGQGMNFTIASQNQGHTARVEPSFHYVPDARSRLLRLVGDHLSQAYVFPGGTPIQDSLGGWPLDRVAPLVRHAKQWGRPVVFIGVGVERLRQEGSAEKVRRDIASAVAHWTVRSESDRQRLLEMGVPANRVTVAADMAWLLTPAPRDFGRKALAEHMPPAHGRPLVGVNINAEPAMLEHCPQMFEILAGALDRIVREKNARIVFLNNEVRDEPTYDLAAAQRVRGLMERAEDAVVFPNTYLSPSEMMSIIGECQLTISSRYHFCLFSAVQGTPFLPLKRSDKVIDLSADLAWNHGSTLRELNADTLVQQAQQLLVSPEPDLARLSQRIKQMRQRAEANRVGLETLRKEARAYNRLEWLRMALQKVFIIG